MLGKIVAKMWIKVAISFKLTLIYAYSFSHIMLKGFEVIYQTRATVFHQDIQTARRELKIRRAAEYF